MQLQFQTNGGLETAHFLPRHPELGLVTLSPWGLRILPLGVVSMFFAIQLPMVMGVQQQLVPTVL